MSLLSRMRRRSHSARQDGLTQEARDALGAMSPDIRPVAHATREVGLALLQVASQTFRLYLDLAPDGGELNAEEKMLVRERLEIGALCLRDADDVRDFIRHLAKDEGLDLHITISALRGMQRSLILLLSDQPERRQRAMSTDEVKKRMEPVAAFWSRALNQK